jgi:hypothetical protein
MRGERALDARWTGPIGDVLNTYMRGLRVLSIRGIAEWTVKLAKTLR